MIVEPQNARLWEGVNRKIGRSLEFGFCALVCHGGRDPPLVQNGQQSLLHAG